MQHFDYDIFISYRRHDKKSLDNINENAGTNIARALYYALINKGYKVYFDCVLHGATQSDTIVEKSKLVLLLVADYTFCDADGWDDNNRIGGLHKEMFWLCQRFGITKNDTALTDKQKKSIINPVILPVNVDKALDDENNLPCYKWLTSLGRVNLHTDEDFDIFFNDLVTVLQEGKPEFQLNVQPSCPTRDFLEQELADANRDTERLENELNKKNKKLKMTSFGAIILIVVVLYLFLNSLLPVIVTVGNNTVSEYLEGRGMPLNNWHGFFFHLRSHDAWATLDAATRRSDCKVLGNFPIILTTDETIDSSILEDTYPKLKKDDEDCRILQYEIDQINLALYVFQDTLIKDELSRDTIQGDSLIKLLQRQDVFVMGADSLSNITKAFNEYIHSFDTSFDINTIIDTKFHKYNPRNMRIIQSHIADSSHIVILLDNTTVEYGTTISKRAKTLIIPKKMSLYAYTFIKVKGDISHARIEFYNGQELFFLRKQMNWGELKFLNKPMIRPDEYIDSIVIHRKSSAIK